MASVFGVQYVTGGSSNFEVKTLTYKSGKKEDLQKHVDDCRKMGYPAMVYNTVIGGFCDKTDFATPDEAIEYYQTIIKTHL